MRYARRARGLGLVIVGLLVGMLLITPATAHFTQNTRHLGVHAWRQVIRAKVFTKAQANNRFLQNAPGTVGTDNLADGAVGTGKIANGAITNPKLADGAVGTAKIANGAVTEAKVSDAIATKGGNEAIRLVGTAGNPPFQGAWGNFGAGFTPVSFYLDQFGVVHLQGLANCAAGTMFTLPTGYRPATNHFQSVATGPAVSDTAGMSITSAGAVVVFSCNAWTSLENIQFRVGT
jgi:hypothetical protein